MRSLTKAFSVLLFASTVGITLSSCSSATVYQKISKESDGLGYQDITVDDSTYRVKFWGDSHNKEEDVNCAAMYRVAEFTVEKGFDYFVILDDMMSQQKRGEWTSYTTIGSNRFDAHGKQQADFVSHDEFGPVRTKTF